MSDAAVSADSGPAPIEGAPINESPSGFIQPLGSQIPSDAVAKSDEPKAPPSLDDSIDRAIAKSAAKQEGKEPPKADVKAEQAAKEPAKAEQPRENGRFAKDPAKVEAPTPADTAKPVEQVKPSHIAEDAPARFTETAKAKWHGADPEIRGEVLRMQRELTDGYQKHKEAAERDGTLAEFHEMAKASGKELPNVVREYVNMENALRKDPVGGLDLICQRLGFSLRDVAAHVLNQTPDQNASQQDAIIRELNNKISQLEQQLGGVTQTINKQREQSTLAEINKFAAENPRFEELADDIAFFMKSGRAKDLPEAYQLAERLNPAPASQAKDEPPAASSAAPAPSVQTDKGLKSINGAPSSGSSPAAKKRVAKSLDDALNAAFGRAG
jgi:hypothetical protein